jgi:CRISPR type III-A-associated RAMP protein Csm4
MNPGLVVKLRPAGPWRIGPDSGARNRVDAIYHSDSLYSAVTSAMSRMGSLAAWLDATARSQTPAVCFSSCFPFLDDIGFVVPPRTIWPPTSPAAMSARVRWKSARFIPLSVVESILSGKKLNENQWSVDGASGCLVPAGKPGPFRTSVRWNAAVDRLSGCSERHATACIEFREGCGLWTVVGFRDEAARDQWQEPVKAAFRWLADSGFGGERSRGWGRSETPEFVEGTLPGLIIEYRRREPAPAVEEPPVEEPPVKEAPMVEPPPAEEPLPESEPPVEAEAAAPAPEAEAAAPESEPAAEAEPSAPAVEAAAPEPVLATAPEAEAEAAVPAVIAAAPETVPATEPAPEAQAAAPETEPVVEAESSAPAVEAAAPETVPATEPAPEAQAAVPETEPAAEAESSAPAVDLSKSRLAGESACPTKTQALADQRGTDAFVCQPGDLGDLVPATEPAPEAQAAAPEPEPATEAESPAPAVEGVEAAAPEAEAAAPAPEAEAAAPAPQSEPALSDAPMVAAVRAPDRTELMRLTPEREAAPAVPAPAVHLQAHWLLSLFTPAPSDAVDWGRGSYTVLARGGRIDSPSGSGELKKQIQMVAEGSVLYVDGVPLGAAADVAPDGFAHPVFRAGFALAIPLPEVH